MAILLSQILKDVTSLDQRVKLESANNTEGRKKIFENEQRMIDSLLEARRLLKTFLSDLSKTKSSIEISDNRPIDQKNASYFSQDSSEAINGSQESPNAIDGLQDLLRVIRSGSGDASESLREIIRGEHRWSLDDKSRLSDIRDDVLAFRPMLQALERALQKPLSLTLISQSD
jgi:hypothetical protein